WSATRSRIATADPVVLRLPGSKGCASSVLSAAAYTRKPFAYIARVPVAIVSTLPDSTLIAAIREFETPPERIAKSTHFPPGRKLGANQLDVVSCVVATTRDSPP